MILFSKKILKVYANLLILSGYKLLKSTHLMMVVVEQ
jgi:hypothetical protein